MNEYRINYYTTQYIFTKNKSVNMEETKVPLSSLLLVILNTNNAS